MKPGVFCFNPPYGVRIGAEQGDEELLALYSDMGRALARLQRVARRLFRGESRLRLRLRPRADHDQTRQQRRPPRPFLVFQL